MDEKKIRKIGNSLGVIFNATLLAAVSKISESDTVKIEYKHNQIIIRKSE